MAAKRRRSRKKTGGFPPAKPTKFAHPLGEPVAFLPPPLGALFFCASCVSGAFSRLLNCGFEDEPNSGPALSALRLIAVRGGTRPAPSDRPLLSAGSAAGHRAGQRLPQIHAAPPRLVVHAGSSEHHGARAFRIAGRTRCAAEELADGHRRLRLRPELRATRRRHLRDPPRQLQHLHFHDGAAGGPGAQIRRRAAPGARLRDRFAGRYGGKGKIRFAL